MISLMKPPASLDGPGCGHDDHEESCLCDVRINAPVAVNYHPRDVANADIVRNALGISDLAEADPATVLNFMAALTNLTEMAAMYDEGPVEDILDKRDVLKAHLRGGGKMATAHRATGLPLRELNRIISRNNEESLVRFFTLDTWAILENGLDAGLSQAKIGDAIGMSRASVWYLAQFFRGTN